MELNRGIILVVDDEPDLTSLISEALQADGFTVIEAHDGYSAMAILRSRVDEIALVMSDLTMPKLGGLDFLKMCLNEFGYVPMVMVSAHSDHERLTEVVRLGAIDYLVKPVSLQTLREQAPVWLEIGRRNRDVLNRHSPRMDGLLRLHNCKILRGNVR